MATQSNAKPWLSHDVDVGFAFASGAHDARQPFRGPSAAVRRGRKGRAAGEPRDGLAFSRGQEPARVIVFKPARPRLTDFPSRDGRKATPRGVVSSWLLLLDSGHPALRPSGQLRCSPPLLRRRGQAKEK